MDLIFAVGALVLVGLLIVGLFHGPSHREAHRRPHRDRTPPQPADPARTGEPASPAAPLASAPSADLPLDPPAYVMPPPRHHRLARRPANGPRGRRP